ncbi:carboxymuconolactone decarboxylase family protein [Streptomyces sp. NPDC006645]|uniref:carboxymuconolactone decarboxylase family protein n=1 Tax=unclassified Streptomyces TaxID=2593676 RepID=UPI0033AD224D
MPRIPYPKKLPDVIDRLPIPLNIFKMLSHAPDLVAPTADLGLALLTNSSLPPSTREMVIMAVAAEVKCAYIAVQHTPIALDSGVTQEQLDAIAARGRRNEHFDAFHAFHSAFDAFDTSETVALDVAHDLLLSRAVEPDAFEAARNHYPECQITELIMLVGYYSMIAGLANGLDIDIDPWQDREHGRAAQPAAGANRRE